MREVEFRKLVAEEFLALIKDPRVERSRKHPLETILVLWLLAMISGADDFVAIERYGTAKQAWLSTFLDLSGGVPSHDTLGRVFALLDTTSLAQAFRRWTLAMATHSREKLIAIDGKALRRSFKHAGDHAFVHMVSAWSASNGVVQERRDGGDLVGLVVGLHLPSGNAAANFSAVRQLALGLLKQRTETKVGIKNRRHVAGWDHDFLLRVIGLNA